MFIIHAQKHNVTEIDIFGDIGEDYFAQMMGEDENTIKSMKEQLDEINGDILVNISSLGGNAFEGMGIHDLLKSYNKGTVTTKIIGATASAGTFIALAGNPVQISENALFLIHNSHTLVQGNATEMRETADMLDKFDSLQNNLYCKKTKMKPYAITELMKEEKWITAAEAKLMGFVDEVLVPIAIAAKYDNTKIKAAGLPELPEYFLDKKMENNETLTTKILAAIGFKSDEILKADNIRLQDEILALQNKAPEAVDTTPFTTEITSLKEVVEAKVVAYETLTTDLNEIKAELEAVKLELAKASAGTVVIAASEDPDPSGTPSAPVAVNPFPLSESGKALFEQAKFYKENK